MLKEINKQKDNKENFIKFIFSEYNKNNTIKLILKKMFYWLILIININQLQNS